MADQYDVISAAMDITPERQKQVLFADGWLESGGRIVTPQNSSIKSAADLKERPSERWSHRLGARLQPTKAPM